LPGYPIRRSSKRPAGVEPALPPWQGSRLPLHHGRDLEMLNCQRTKSTGPESNRRCRVTSAESLPLNDQCLPISVGPEGLEPSPTWLRARHAAASTLIPFFVFCCFALSWRGGNRTLDLCLIRTLLSPLSYAPVGPKGVEPLPFRLKGGSATVTPRPQVWIGDVSV
jgi:hypothetical protein